MPGRQRGQQRNQRGKRNSHRGRRGMIPTANGFLYEPSYKIDYEDDFRLYAQFGSEEEQEGPQPLSKKGHKNKKPQYSKKNNNQSQRPVKQKSYHTPVKFTKATTLFEKEEEAMMTKENIHGQIMKGVKDKTKKKRKNRQQVDDDVEVDPEIFRYTLERAMAEIPPGLRPGMRSWYDKQQKRKEAKKEKQKQKKTRQQKEDKKSKKNKKNNSYDQDFDLTKIDRRIREFITDSSISCYEFRPMPPYVRKQVHILAQAYNLLSEGTGKGADRYIVIRKTSETEIPENRSSIELYIEELQQTIDVVTSRQRKHNEPSELSKEKNRNKKNSKGKTKKPGNNKKQTTMPAPGTVVGDDVAPISQDNVGHRMLAAMGWRQGQALGTSNDGIVNPIMAVVRRNKLGLGL
ncbi:hypothetical protein RMATCC62417_14111 [Rhizopus microsporus]|nr:hypothetical protein RMATCC62417_14111 [Rhizopus microsporus]